MNRIEFMTTLASHLQDIPAEERREAMKYYNDYFDEAGAENEEQVIKELGSPEKVAGTIKEGIYGNPEENGEFTDTGYHEPKFEKQDVPELKQRKRAEYDYSCDNTKVNTGKKPWTSKTLKVILIIAIAICAAPIILPILVGIIAAIAGCLIALVAVFLVLVAASAAVAIAGLAIFISGTVHLFNELAVGLALTGVGLILLPLGAIATVASIKLCIVVFPGIIRGIVWLCRRPFQRKAVA